MYKYFSCARVNAYQAVNTRAEKDWAAKQIAKAELGFGNVFNYARPSDRPP